MVDGRGKKQLLFVPFPLPRFHPGRITGRVLLHSFQRSGPRILCLILHVPQVSLSMEGLKCWRELGWNLSRYQTEIAECECSQQLRSELPGYPSIND